MGNVYHLSFFAKSNFNVEDKIEVIQMKISEHMSLTSAAVTSLGL